MSLSKLRQLAAAVTFLTAYASASPTPGDWDYSEHQPCPNVCSQQCDTVITSYVTITPITEIDQVTISPADSPMTTIFSESTITIYTILTGSEGISTIPVSTSVVPALTYCPPEEMTPTVYTKTYPEGTVTVYNTVTGSSGPSIVTVISVIPASTVLETSTIYGAGVVEQTTVVYTTITGPSGTLTAPIATNTVTPETIIYPESTVTIYATIAGSPTPISTSVIPASTYCPDQIIETMITTYVTSISEVTTSIPISTSTCSASVTTIYETLNSNPNITIPMTTTLPPSSQIIYTSTCLNITETIPMTSTITVPYPNSTISHLPTTCTPDNCLQQMLASPAITSFCASFTTLPPPTSNSSVPGIRDAEDCVSESYCTDAAALSSARSCATMGSFSLFPSFSSSSGSSSGSSSSSRSSSSSSSSSSMLPKMQQTGNASLTATSASSIKNGTYYCPHCAPSLTYVTGWDTLVVTATAAQTSGSGQPLNGTKSTGMFPLLMSTLESRRVRPSGSMLVVNGTRTM